MTTRRDQVRAAMERGAIGIVRTVYAYYVDCITVDITPPPWRAGSVLNADGRRGQLAVLANVLWEFESRVVGLSFTDKVEVVLEPTFPLEAVPELCERACLTAWNALRPVTE